jgi:3-dehydroquinate dehydratase-2
MTGTGAFPTAEWAAELGRGLKPFRSSDRAWRLCLIDGPNMSNLGAGGRDPRTYGVTPSLSALHSCMRGLTNGLAVRLDTYHSNHEGDIVAFVYEHAAEIDAFLINPAALTRRGAPCSIALLDSGRPYIELHFANIAALGWIGGAIITKGATGVVMGLRQYSYIGAVFGLVGALDAGLLADGQPDCAQDASIS